MNNFFQKKFYSPLIISILLFLFTGCGSSTPTVDLEHLQNEAGDYQYGNITWSSDKAAVEAALGVTFEQTLLDTDQAKSYATSAGACSWNGIPAAVTCEFDGAGNCTVVTFIFSPSADKAENFWTDITSELLSRYGSTDPIILDSNSGQLQAAIQNTTYLWENSGTMHTALSVSKTSRNNSSPSIYLSIYVIPADRTN